MANKQWIYVSRPQEEVTEENYKLISSSMPEPQEGEILIKALYISVDPYQRIQQSSLDTWEKPHPLNQVQGGGSIGKVIQSKDANIAVGSLVQAYTGWQEYAVCSGKSVRILEQKHPIEYSLGILGMPGRTAYFGLLEIGKPQIGETCVVSGAAGAVGSIVVQIAKIKGCKVIGICGSEEKKQYVQSLGADEVINYKNCTTHLEMRQALEKACPKGIDIYFDNTGGITTDAVFDLINVRARVIICGQISQYNGNLDKPEMGPRFLHKLIYTRATIQGILARDFAARHSEMLEVMGQWLQEHKIKYDVTILEGFENLPKALNGLFHGKNTGKMLVKL